MNTQSLNQGRGHAATQSSPQTMTLNPGFFSQRTMSDWLFAALLLIGAGWVFFRYGAVMDVYETSILAGTVPALIWLGWFWRPLQALMIGVAVLSLWAIATYQVDGKADLARADQAFILKYFLSSQSAILWMSMLFFMSTVFYWLGVFSRQHAPTMEALGSKVAWAGVVLALVGTMVRWYEGHQMGPDIGHIPVSNLYEVFVLFCWMTALFYLYYETIY
ncbi:MAG: c-type cytochrome biosis protein CcsB, partial [Pseudomonadota bacterium]